MAAQVVRGVAPERTRPPVAASRRVARWGATAAWAFTALFVVLNAVYVVLVRSAPTAWRGVEDYLDTWIVLEQGPQVVGLVALPVLGFVLAAVHQLASPARRVFSHTALLFGFTFITVTWTGYFLQVAWLIPHIQEGSRAGIEMMAFRNNAGLAWAADVAGWALSGFMGVALFGVFPGRGLEARLRWLFLGYGVGNLLLLPWLMFGIAALGIPIIASWLLVLPAATAHLAMWFRRRERPDGGLPRSTLG